MKRYCITDSLDVVRLATLKGATMIQIRAKDLPSRSLVALVRASLALASCPVLVNTRTDIALACGAQGVHLPSHAVSPRAIRRIAPRSFLIGVSCHSTPELRAAENEGADFAVFGPIYASPTKSVHPIGLDALLAATASVRLPVYALGGVTEQNESLCIQAGAAGIAGISFFT